ncbi:hypothetical protein PAMA_002194 [Pampus argenteus]
MPGRGRGEREEEEEEEGAQGGSENCVHIMTTGGEYNPSAKPLVSLQELPLDVFRFRAASEGRSGGESRFHKPHEGQAVEVR